MITLDSVYVIDNDKLYKYLPHKNCFTGVSAICPNFMLFLLGDSVMHLSLRASLNSLKGPSIWQIPSYRYLLVAGMLSTRLYKSCSSLCLITASKLLSRFRLRCWTSSRMRSASAKWRVEFVGKKPEKKYHIGIG